LIWIYFDFGGIFVKFGVDFDFFFGFRDSFEWIFGSKGMIIAAVDHISQWH
jgi:hypothetical protein